MNVPIFRHLRGRHRLSAFVIKGHWCSRNAVRTIWDECRARTVVKRLYQWLQNRARSFRVVARAGQGRRTVRTLVTVEEQQRTVLLSVATRDGVCVCPLCGKPVNALSTEGTGVITLEHSQIHTQCPEPELGVVQREQGSTPRLGNGRGTRRLR